MRGAGLLAAGSLCGSPMRVEAIPTIYNGAKAPGAAELMIPHPAPPPVPFDSNHNYVMYGGGVPIFGVVITIDIKEDLVAHDGMSMQLNCVSGPANANCIWQQYVTGLDPRAKSPNLRVGSSIENFPSSAYRVQQNADIGLHVTKDAKGLHGDLFNE
ncbi:MAG TPA: hypothetical protein VIW78_03425, partial [Burkholderiales bacterium]